MKGWRDPLHPAALLAVRARSSPGQAHRVNLFPKHSVDKFYRRLGK